MKYIEKGLFELLKTLAGGKVYAMRAEQGATGPFVIFQNTDSGRWRSINNPSGIAQAQFRIDAYAQEFYEAKALAGQIEAALDGYRGTVYYEGDSPQDSIFIAGISLQTESDILDETENPLLFRNTALYLVTYHQR